MAANLHAVAVTTVTLTNAAEGVIATLTPFTEAQAGEFAQGVVIQANVNVTIGTSGTAIVLRVRKGSLTGTLVGAAQTITAAAGNTVAATIDELDTVLAQNVTYVLTGQVTAGAANSTVNRAVLTAEDATAFE